MRGPHSTKHDARMKSVRLPIAKTIHCPELLLLQSYFHFQARVIRLTIIRPSILQLSKPLKQHRKQLGKNVRSNQIVASPADHRIAQVEIKSKGGYDLQGSAIDHLIRGRTCKRRDKLQRRWVQRKSSESEWCLID